MEENAVENLHDFEEEAVDDMFRNKKEIPKCLQNKPEAEQRLLKVPNFFVYKHEKKTEFIRTLLKELDDFFEVF